MRIGEFAKKARFNPKTVRYYEEIGLLPPAPRTESGYRQYADKDAERLEFIRSARCERGWIAPCAAHHELTSTLTSMPASLCPGSVQIAS